MVSQFQFQAAWAQMRCDDPLGQMPVPYDQHAQIKGETLKLLFAQCSLWHARAVWWAAPSQALALLSLPCMEEPVGLWR